ncbi:MORN repeat-containing protein 3 isoform X2 [Pygocentrus nattereri]|uniref:MORN repeat-containing protein 3 isoform X2 n=1 Tax=Pygocentrus nattereri TaxID=42514 RepID=UPI0008149B59|nr:MORN repeat-containing protein 3 isoform X2 [Pygocentrus nattereri]
MPRLKNHQKAESLAKLSDKKAQKSGVHCTVYSVNGDQYTGDWLDNKKHGKGTQVWKRAEVMYDGDWKFGKRDGFGTLSRCLPLSSDYVRVYSGEWRNDKKEGFGTQFYSASSWYEGQWVGHQRSGSGRMYYPNGDIYEGEWLKDKPHGQGILTLANKNKYEGSWKDGKKNGHGRFFYLDRGQLYEGFWVDDVAKCGTVCDYGRDQAATPTTYPLPQVQLKEFVLVCSALADCCWDSECYSLCPKSGHV